jgi:hypothetical protein
MREMEKKYNFVPLFLILLFIVSGLSAATSAVQSAVPVPLKTDLFAETSAANVAATAQETVATKLIGSKKDDSLITQEGVATPVISAGAVGFATLATVDDMRNFMRAFKDVEIEEIQKTLNGLEKMLYAIEKQLTDLKKDSDPKELLVQWAKIKSALDGERQVLAAVKAMPEAMAFPEEELGYGYDQAKKTIVLLSSDKNVTKETVAQDLINYQNWAFKKIKDAEKDKKIEAIKKGRDNLAAYYELAISLYDDFLRMIDGLWLVSGHAFVKQKVSEIENLKQKFEPENGQVLIALEGVAGLVSEKLKKRFEAELANEECKKKRNAEYVKKIEKYRSQQKAIWQNDGAVVGKRELIEQRMADWNEAKAAETDARAAKGVNDDWIKAAVAVTNESWDAVVKDQGRYDLEQVIHQARETLRTLVNSIRAIDENDLETVTTKRGMRVLMHEAGLFNQTKRMNGSLGNSFFNYVTVGLSKHIALFKEMKPISADFDMRLRAVTRMCPGVAVVLPTVRFLADKYAPGLVDVWA